MPDDLAATPTDILIDRFRAGERRDEIFRLLFDRHYRLLRRYFCQRGLPLDVVEDLTQETFLRVYRGLDGFRGEARFASWLLRIAQNVLRQSHERSHTLKRSRPEVQTEGGSNLEEAATTHGELPVAVGRLIDREQEEAVRLALARLPAQMRRCASLRLLYDLKYQEIAEVLQISLQTVKVQLHRARKRLKSDLAVYFERRS